jgi:hypothetical protein
MERSLRNVKMRAPDRCGIILLVTKRNPPEFIAIFPWKWASTPACPPWAVWRPCWELRAAADLGLPMIGVTLLHRKGYFRQTLDADGNQSERPVAWSYEEILEPMVPRAFVPIAGRVVGIRAWRYVVRGVFGHTVPVYFLDTGLKENEPWEQSLTEALYDGDNRHRLCQEGLGGRRCSALVTRTSAPSYDRGHAAFRRWRF